MKKLLLAAAMIALSFPAHATTTIDQMTTGPGTLTGAEELPFLYSGTTTSYKTTAQQIANLGGGIPPGAQGNIPVNNGSGVYAAQNDFYAAGFNAVCDGLIIPAGVVTTSGSPNLAIATGQDASVTFSGLHAGDAIVLQNPAQTNTGVSPATVQISSILSVSGNTAVMANNATFNSSNAYTNQMPGASLRAYKTVNTSALQAVFNAAFATGIGAHIILPAGVCGTGHLTFPYSQMKLTGAGPQSSILMLVNGSNSDLFTSFNFSSLTGGGSNLGAMGWDIEDVGLDGNKGANTATGIGTNTGTGGLLRFYGAGYYMNRVAFSNAAGDAVYSEWTGANGGDPLNAQFSGNGHPQNLQFANNAGWAWVYNGPHDGYILNSDMTNCGTGGILQGSDNIPAGSTGSPLIIIGTHIYQCSSVGQDLNADAGVRIFTSNFEGTSLLKEDSYDLVDSTFGTLMLGATTTSPAVFDVRDSFSEFGTVINNAGSGFNDEWVGGSIGTLTQNTPYNPWFAFGVQHGTNSSNAPYFNGVSLDPNGAEAVQVIRPCCGNNINGVNLTIGAGGATAGQTNRNGGNLILSSGISTGLGTSQIQFNVFGATTTGFGDNTATQAMTLTSSGYLGLGATTTNPADKLDVGGAIGITATTATLPINGFASTVANTLVLTTSSVASVEVNAFGHEIVAGASPSVASGATACGTSPSIAGTDNSGVVVTGTSPSGSCVVTFANPWTNAPDSCGCTNNTSTARGCSALSISTTSVALVATTSPHTGGDSLGYSCESHRF